MGDEVQVGMMVQTTMAVPYFKKFEKDKKVLGMLQPGQMISVMDKKMDKKGKPKRSPDESVDGMLKSILQGEPVEVDDQTIIDRLMIPMIIETARCLEEGIVDTANEADMGLIFGIGFPPFHGGALKYADRLGLKALCDRAAEFAHFGPLYQPTQRMLEMAANNERYYG